MMPWWAWLALGVSVVSFLPFVIRWFTVETCRYCSYPLDRCDCDDCDVSATGHHAFSAWRWSQDGFVRQCKLCKAVQYGGDDYDGGPDDGGRVVSDRQRGA